jgi:hypothetical protein
VADVFPEGVWIDTQTGRVVLAQPVEGVQIAAPGVPVPDGQQAAVAEAVAGATPAPTKRAAAKPAEDTATGDNTPAPRARSRKS